MKFLNLFVVVFSLLFLMNCKNEEVSNDEYEILNLLTSKIIYPIPAPPPLHFKNEENLSEDEKVKIIEEIIRKDSVVKSKIDFTIKFEDSLIGVEKDFSTQLYEKLKGFEEFYLVEINEDLTKSKKINLKKLNFPKNIKLTKTYNANYSKWQEDFIGHYWVSRIIFNKNKDKAVTEFNHDCGNHCGSGTIIYLQKTNGKWKIMQTFNSWVS